MVNIPATAQDLSNEYTALGSFIGLATANGSGTPVEIPSGASGYARAQTNWTPQGGGVNVGTAVTLSAPEGGYDFVILCTESDADQPGDKMVDYCKIDVILNGDGQVVITPQYTQT